MEISHILFNLPIWMVQSIGFWCAHRLYSHIVINVEHFHHSKRKIHTIDNHFTFPILPSLETPNLLSASVDLPILDTSYKWDYTVNPKGSQPWIFIGRTYAEAEAPSNTSTTWCKEPTRWKRLWCWERLKAAEWDGWVASLTPWIWIWANSGR